MHSKWHDASHMSVLPLQVLSHNLYTVLNIPHDPVALEEHFQDDDDGPVSNHGYMPYLNKYILDKVLKSPPQEQLYEYRNVGSSFCIYVRLFL